MIVELYRRHGFSVASFYLRHNKFGGTWSNAKTIIEA